MSELVESHLESMTDELAELKRIKLFSPEEVKLIVKTRKEHEYRINGVTKHKEDYIAYIMYEKAVLKDIRIRRNKLGIADKKGAIEYKIIKRIHKLYENAIQRYSDDFPLSLSYFKFCKDANFQQTASLIIQNMTKKFIHIPEAWLVAASWYLKSDLNQALNMIYKGITHHKDNQDLYCEAVKLELYNRGKNNIREESQESQKATESEINSCKKIKTYIEAACEHIKDYNFLLKILSMLETYPFTKEVQDSIVTMLLEKHSDEETVWSALAQREFKGHYYQVPPEFQNSKSKKFRRKRSLEKFEEGIEVMKQKNPDKVPVLWGICLDWLVDEFRQQPLLNIVRQSDVLDMFEKASKSTALEEKYYVIWAQLEDDQTKVLQVIEKGLEANPASLSLWRLRLKYFGMQNNTKEFNECFSKAVFHVQSKSAPLWVAAIGYHTLNSTEDVVEAIFKKAVASPKEISDIFKPEYIEWLTLHKGINEARQTYLELAKKKPYCKELHNAMAKIEEIEMQPDVVKLENIYKLACEQFGHEDCDVWITLVEFYYKHRIALMECDPKFDLTEPVYAVHQEAKKKLGDQSFLWANFQEKFRLISQTAPL
ncbi:unnamed protein product [Callosobruchus maculatus]|uniref:U3 small nucleolar RNA-associated protein 6 homolog n=1 Tax=Callosobruchus maculatus TaxID=64391 RepID=A0A653BZ09_CALMS|nr:unnamed protein product [Callosobruchus maculatus]